MTNSQFWSKPIKANKVSWKDMAAYFYCDSVAYHIDRNNRQISFEIDTRKSNRKKYFPGVFIMSYEDFKNSTTKVWLEKEKGSYYKLELESIIRR